MTKSWGLFSWFGRRSIVKMNILPRILYIMQAVPLRIPQAFLASYRRACTEFIWGKSHSRLSFERLTLPKMKGDIGLPDIVKYHWGCQLARIIDCNIHSHTKAWVHLEHAFSPLPLQTSMDHFNSHTTRMQTIPFNWQRATNFQNGMP